MGTFEATQCVAWTSRVFHTHQLLVVYSLPATCIHNNSSNERHTDARPDTCLRADDRALFALLSAPLRRLTKLENRAPNPGASPAASLMPRVRLFQARASGSTSTMTRHIWSGRLSYDRKLIARGSSVSPIWRTPSTSSLPKPTVWPRRGSARSSKQARIKSSTSRSAQRSNHSSNFATKRDSRSQASPREHYISAMPMEVFPSPPRRGSPWAFRSRPAIATVACDSRHCPRGPSSSKPSSIARNTLRSNWLIRRSRPVRWRHSRCGPV